MRARQPASGSDLRLDPNSLFHHNVVNQLWRHAMGADVGQSETRSLISWGLLAIALVAIALFGMHTIENAQFWGHLADGQYQIEHGVPRIASQTLTADGAPWIDPHWLYNNLLVRLWNAGGAPAVILAHVVAVLLAFASLIPVARQWASPAVMAAALLLCGRLLSFQFHVTADTFTLLFPALFILLLSAGRNTILLWVALPLIQWFWTNMHTTFLLGPIFCLFAAAQSRFQPRGDAGSHPPRLYLLLALLTLVVTVLNPYFLNLHVHTIRNWFDPRQIFQVEWISPLAAQFKTSGPTVMIVTALVFGAAGLILYRNRLPILATLLATVSAFVAVRSLQHIELLALLAFPFLSLSMQSALDTLSDLFKSRARSIRLALGAALAVLLASALHGAVSGRFLTGSGSASRFGFGVETSLYPEACAALIERDSFPETVLTDPYLGSFMRWKFPERSVSIDQRTALYDGEFLQPWMGALSDNREALETVLSTWSPSAAVLALYRNKSAGLALSLIERYGWSLLYFDGAVAVLAAPEKAAALADPAMRREGLALLQGDVESLREALRSGASPANSPRVIGGANLLFALNHIDRCIPLFRLALAVNRAIPTGWMTLGLASLQQGDAKAAVEALEHACRMTPRHALAWLWLSRGYALLNRSTDAAQAFARGEQLNPDLAAAFGGGAK
jgi:hypothetical protein